MTNIGIDTSVKSLQPRIERLGHDLQRADALEKHEKRDRKRAQAERHRRAREQDDERRR